MVKIWVTRSEPGSSVLVNALQQAGYTAWQAPVLEVQPLRPWRASVNEADEVKELKVAETSDTAWLEQQPGVVIALSAHAAVEFIAADLLRHAEAAHFLAIGRQTAAVLERRGVVVNVPEHSTSEGLLQMPDLVQLGQSDTVWILAGAGGRALLLQQLHERKRCRVVKFELYRRQTNSVGAIDIEGIGAVIVSSQQGMLAATEQWRGAGGGLDVALIVPSSRVRDKAAALGFANVHTAQGASAAAVLAVLAQLVL